MSRLQPTTKAPQQTVRSRFITDQKCWVYNELLITTGKGQEISKVFYHYHLRHDMDQNLQLGHIQTKTVITAQALDTAGCVSKCCECGCLELEQFGPQYTLVTVNVPKHTKTFCYLGDFFLRLDLRVFVVVVVVYSFFSQLTDAHDQLVSL